MNRTTVALAGVLGVLIVVALLLPGHGKQPAPVPAPTKTVTVTVTAEPTPDPVDPAPSVIPTPTVAEVEGVAARYADLYASPAGTQAEWLNALRPVTAPDLLLGLAYTDRSRLPRQRQSVHVEQVSAGSEEEPGFGSATVIFASGPAVLFSFQQVAGGWVCIDMEAAA